MLDQYQVSADELTWRFQRADAEIGIRGQSFEGGGGHVFDEAASNRMHRQRHTVRWSASLAKRQKIDATLAEASAVRGTLESCFTPFGRVTPIVDAYFTVNGIRLFGIAVDSRAARVAFGKKFAAIEPAMADRELQSRGQVWCVVGWFEDEARSFAKSEADIARVRTTKPSGHVFERILNETVSTAEHARELYEGFRRARHEREEGAKEEYLQEQLAETHRRVWGAP